jgi:hypothetical protein
MRPSLAIAFAAVLLPVTLLGSPQPRPTSLFDGWTSTGWEEGNLAHFRIADGAIVGGTMAAAIARNEFRSSPPSEAWHRDITLTELKP